MRVCKYLNQKVRRTGEWNGKSFKGFPTISHNSIQDRVFTTIYRLQESAWKNAWSDMFSKGSRLFFKKNQNIRYTLTNKIWFELYCYKFNSIFKHLNNNFSQEEVNKDCIIQYQTITGTKEPSKFWKIQWNSKDIKQVL